MMIKNVSKKHDLGLLFNQEFNFISDLLDNVNLPSEKSDDSDSEMENNVLGEEFEEKNKKTKYKNRIKKLKTKAEKIQRVSDKKECDSSTSHVSEKKLPKPVFNGNGNLVFSKFDFLGETSTVVDKETLGKTDTRSKKQLLEKFAKKKNLIRRLEESGDVGKANKIKEESAWQNAFRKVEGEKVKDDPHLLKKSLAKKESKKKASQKKWKERVRTAEKQKVERQKKRAENISKRIQEKKKTKLKKATKKGRHIPNL